LGGSADGPEEGVPDASVAQVAPSAAAGAEEAAADTDRPEGGDDEEHVATPALDRRSIQAARRRDHKQHRRKWPKRLAIVAGVLVLLAAATAAGGYFYVRYRFDQIRKVHARHLVKVEDPGKPIDILIVGSDTRAFVSNPTQQKAFGSPTVEGGQRSDVTMVARIIPATKQVWILSIPRDLWVDIPGQVAGVSGMNRINTAFNSGPDLLIQTIEQDLHIPINYYVAVNFNGFQSMVDALGGITMDFPMPVKDSYSGLDVTTTGCQVVPGATSLELVRSRHLYYEQNGTWNYDGNSDLSRIQRQDEFFRAVLNKLNASIFNPFTLNSFIGAAVGNLTIDDTLSIGEIFRLAEQFHGMPSSNLHTETLPSYGYTTDGGAQVLGEAQPYAEQMIFEFDLLGANAGGSTSTTHGRAPPAPTTTTTPTLAPAAVQVEVLNGSGVANAAGDTASALRAQGFDVTGAADASTYGYGQAVIEYGPDGAEAAATLAPYVGGGAQLQADSSLTGSEVTLIVGSSTTGIVTPAAATGTGTTSGTAVGSGTGGSGTAAGSPGTSSTTTTIPANVYTNATPEAWNPVPCQL
jgi:LCP family protein required for cell wall assembly